MKFATKPIRQYPSHLRHVATLPLEIRNSNFCRYSAHMEENANKLHFKCANFNFCTRVTVCWVHLSVFIKILSSLLYTMLTVDRHCGDVCCDKFPVPQIDRKEQWHGKFYLQQVWRTNRYYKHRKYKNLWMNNKGRGEKYATCVHFLLHLLNIGRKFELLISQGSVATYLRWGG